MKPSHDPRDYACPRCNAQPGRFCQNSKGSKVGSPHNSRVTAMLDAHRPEPMLLSLCEVHAVVLRVNRPYIFRPMGSCIKCFEMAGKAREAYGEKMGELP